MCCRHQTIPAGNEVRTEVAVSRTEDDLVVLSALYAVFHHVAVDVHIISITSFSIIGRVQPSAVAIIHTDNGYKVKGCL